MSIAQRSRSRVILIASLVIAAISAAFLSPKVGGAQETRIQTSCGIRTGTAVGREEAICIAKNIGMQRGLD